MTEKLIEFYMDSGKSRYTGYAHAGSHILSLEIINKLLILEN